MRKIIRDESIDCVESTYIIDIDFLFLADAPDAIFSLCPGRIIKVIIIEDHVPAELQVQAKRSTGFI